MLKHLILFSLLYSYSVAIDFKAFKENAIAYIDNLDHPNRDRENQFSTNLSIADKAHNTHITIYSDGLAMVWEEKNITIPIPGDIKVMYSDVASKIDFSSVSMHFDKNVTLLSQRYAYDTVNFTSLLQKYIGKYILYINDREDKKKKKATLLATDPIIIQDLKSGTIFTPHQVFFENIPEDMAVTPTLFWNLKTEAESLNIKLEYLTEGIDWRSDYNLYLKTDDLLDLNSWITVKNSSGASFFDANITIVTGQLKHVKVLKTEDQNSSVKKKTETKVKNENHEYALFHIGHKENFNNNEEKQLAFIRGEKIRYEEYLLNNKTYDLLDHNSSSLEFSRMLSFENSRSNNLGEALPQGIVRIYNYDTLSSKRFIGSAMIPDIKADEKVTLSIGASGDIIGEEMISAAHITEEKKHVEYSIKLKNITSKSIVIQLKRAIEEEVGKVDIKDSCKEQCVKEKISDLASVYHIRLKPDQPYELKIIYNVTMKSITKGGSL